MKNIFFIYFCFKSFTRNYKHKMASLPTPVEDVIAFAIKTNDFILRISPSNKECKEYAHATAVLLAMIEMFDETEPLTYQSIRTMYFDWIDKYNRPEFNLDPALRESMRISETDRPFISLVKKMFKTYDLFTIAVQNHFKQVDPNWQKAISCLQGRQGLQETTSAVNTRRNHSQPVPVETSWANMVRPTQATTPKKFKPVDRRAKPMPLKEFWQMVR